MNGYLTWSKARLIRQAQNDFLNLTGIKITPWTKKIYFYFFIHEGKKWVSKSGLNFVYTNADTWTNDPLPDHCGLQREFKSVDVVDFLNYYSGKLLPPRQQNQSFFIFDWIEGEPVNSITIDEFFYLHDQNMSMEFTPFYNSMTYNLVRTRDRIYLVDLKHFDRKIDLPFFVYFYNDAHQINRLYVEIGANLDKIIQHLKIDYPVLDAEIIGYRRD